VVACCLINLLTLSQPCFATTSTSLLCCCLDISLDDTREQQSSAVHGACTVELGPRRWRADCGGDMGACEIGSFPWNIPGNIAILSFIYTRASAIRARIPCKFAKFVCLTSAVTCITHQKCNNHFQTNELKNVLGDT